MSDKKIKILGIIGAVCLLVGIIVPKIMPLFQEKIDYNTFISQLEDSKIEIADISEKEGKITYQLKNDKTTYYTSYPDTDDFKETLLKQGVEIKIHHDDNFFSQILNYLPLIMPLLFLGVFAGMTSSKTKFEVIKSNLIKTRFSDVAGNEEIKEELLMISDLMKDKSALDKNIKIPKGVLLQGPPGNGKTLLARAFAGEAGVNFIAATASDFSVKYVGVGSQKIKQLFELARKNAPCVVFIDEIDGVGERRIDGNSAASKEMNTILTSLLNEMDGFEISDEILVLAATNRVNSLDEALIRPGRFDSQFVISYPDKNTRTELLKLYTENNALDENVNLNELANKTYGKSASEIECICNEAAINSIINKHEKIDNNDFQSAIIKSAIKGSIKKNYIQSDNERKIIAYHEAGHAVMAYHYTNREVSTITIKPTTSGAGGFTMTECSDEEGLKTLSELYGQIKMLYGGRAAEYKLNNSNIMNVTTGASEDIKQATKLAMSYICNSQGIDYSFYESYGVKEILDSSKKLLNDIWMECISEILIHWNDVENIAEKLIEKETLSKDEFYSIMKESSLKLKKGA